MSEPKDEKPKCTLCGEPMPPGEEMFKYHGYSGNCPKPPLPRRDSYSHDLGVMKAGGNHRKWKVIEIAPEVIVQICLTGNAWVCVDGLDGKAELRGYCYDPMKCVMRVLVEHPEFPEVPEGQAPPEMQVTFSKLITKKRKEEYDGKPYDAGSDQLFVLAQGQYREVRQH